MTITEAQSIQVAQSPSTATVKQESGLVNFTQSIHKLEVSIVKAVGIRATNFFSKTTSDSYVTISLIGGEQECKTEVDFGTTDPNWNETKQFLLPSQAEDEIDYNSINSNVLFVSVWGRHKISKDTFIGRCEIPISAIVPESELFKETNNVLPAANNNNNNITTNTENSLYNNNLLNEAESSNNRNGIKNKEVWFKLLPQYNSKNYDQITGKILLKFTYNYLPSTPSTVLETASNVAQQVSTVTQPIIETPSTSNVAPHGMVLHYKCPYCDNIYPPTEINNHMTSCTAIATSTSPIEHQTTESNINNNVNNNQQYSPQGSPPQVTMAMNQQQHQDLQQYYAQQYQQQNQQYQQQQQQQYNQCAFPSAPIQQNMTSNPNVVQHINQAY